MRAIAIIPARGGSKRLPGKNTKLLDGLPLIAHSIHYAKANGDCIDEVYVTTDDPEIKSIALRFGAKVIDRPAYLSTDFEPTVSALRHVLESISENIDHIILLQPTNPLRPENLLRDAMAIYHQQNYNSLFTVTRNYQKLGKINGHQFEPFNYKPGQRSQDLEPLYFENGLLYICQPELILKGKIIGEQAFPMVVDHPFSEVDIDTQDDFDYADYLIRKNNEL